MRSLDKYQRYIENDEAANAPAKEKPAPPPAPGSDKNVRYVLRGGVTVAVPITAPERVAPVAEVLPVVEKRREEIVSPDYFPPLIEEAAPPAVEESPSRPRRLSDVPDVSEGDAAALWRRLPRHIQILVGMDEAVTPPAEKTEVASKYYTRGFKETRRQLIERLLDPTLTLEDTARVLGVCPATVRRYTNRGVLPHYRTVGQQRRFRLSDVLGFMQQQAERRGLTDLIDEDDGSDSDA